ncbi:protein of unknown function (plasmid) [Caballeronia sp. S22]
MQYLRVLVHFTPDAMSAILSYDRIAVSAGVPFDGMTYVAKSGSRANGLDPFPHRFIGHLYEPLGYRRHLSDKIGLAGIGNIAVLLQRDVEIDDVPVLQDFSRGWNAVTNNVVT